MPITREDVRKVAALARLALTEEEEKLYTEQLARILTYVEKLSEVDTEGVEPTKYVVPIDKHLREDKVRPSLSQEEALKNAPHADKDCFKVPKIIG
jgi:aspartyl-tRNA(Asn)/glutamyl-tRNA(Gln) amidotransferase subunit C